MEFDQVIAPLDRNEFLTKHWEKSWLHLPGKADRFGDLLTWDDLNAILENTRIVPALMLLSDGHGISLADMCAVLDGEVAVASLKKGLALLVQAGAVVVETR